MRKSLLLSASLVALVVLGALPATASASPELRDKNGKALVAGVGVTGVFQTDLYLETAIGNVVCGTNFDGELKENTGTSIAIEFKTVSLFGEAGTTGKTCVTTIKGPGDKYMQAIVGADDSAPWCLQATAARKDEAWLTGGACGKAQAVRFTVDLYEAIEPHGLVASCTYEADEVEGKGTYTTKGQPVQIPIPKWAFSRKAGNPTWCLKANVGGTLQITTPGSGEPTTIE